jgi:two-component system response regulator YesN
MSSEIRLMIADDEVQIRNGLRVGIDWKAMGISSIYVAKDGLEAYRLCEQHKIELILTDVRMPGIDGLELASRLTYSPRKIVIISGYADFSYAQSAIKFGVEDYMLKPVNIAELTELMRNLVEEVQAEKYVMRLDGGGGESGKAINPGLISHQRFFGKDEHLDLTRNAFDSTLLRTLEYINCHYDEKLTVEEVARYVEKSNNYFSTNFHKSTGYTFVYYLTRLRIEHAKKLLRATSMMTYEIAEKVGFGDYKYFSIVFKRMLGCSPTEYRKGKWSQE